MNRFYISVLLILLSSNCVAQDFPLVGVWKSNEAMTLESMNKVEGVTKKSKKLFSNNFFGKLILDFRSDNELKSFIPGETDDLEEFNKYQPFEILSRNLEYIELRQYSKILNESMTQKYYFNEECLYVYTSKWNFREYFCKFITKSG